MRPLEAGFSGTRRSDCSASSRVGKRLRRAALCPTQSSGEGCSPQDDDSLASWTSVAEATARRSSTEQKDSRWMRSPSLSASRTSEPVRQSSEVPTMARDTLPATDVIGYAAAARSLRAERPASRGKSGRTEALLSLPDTAFPQALADGRIEAVRNDAQPARLTVTRR